MDEKYLNMSATEKNKLQVEITKIGEPANKKTVPLSYIMSKEGQLGMKTQGYIVTDERFKEINMPRTSRANPQADKMAAMEAQLAKLTALVESNGLLDTKEDKPVQIKAAEPKSEEVSEDLEASEKEAEETKQPAKKGRPSNKTK